jgi:hypothetical protein
MEIFKQANGKPKLVLPKKLQKQALAEQASYLEEDPYIGMIQEYLDTHDVNRVCVMMLWREALNHEYDDPPRKLVNELHDIMRNNVTGWKYVGQQRIEKYGRQRCYDRTVTGKIIDIFENVDPNDVPFEKGS